MFIKRKIPPTAVPINVLQLIKSLQRSIFFKNNIEYFQHILSNFLGSKHCYLVSSGRTALYLILKTIKKNSKKTDVIIPAYTCPIVAYTIHQAGLNIKLCDIHPNTLSINESSLKNIIDQNTAAVLPVHLFGIPQKMDKIISICKESNAILIENAAQAFGISINDKKVGTNGDFGFYSLDYGKIFTTGGGGIIVTNNNNYNNHIKDLIKLFPKPSIYSQFIDLIKIFLYPFIISEIGWGIITNSFLDPEKNTKMFKLKPQKFTNIRASIGITLFNNINNILKDRAKNATILINSLKNNKFVTIPKSLNSLNLCHLYLPILIEDEKIRNNICYQLRENGICASKEVGHRWQISNINNLQDKPYNTIINIKNKYKNFPYANNLHKSILILPIHPFIKERERDTILNIFDKYN